MNAEWLSDFRKIPDEVMNYLRRIAVRAVEDQHQSPELIAKIFGISRSCIDDWLRWYHRGGEVELDTRTAPGATLTSVGFFMSHLRALVMISCHGRWARRARVLGNHGRGVTADD